MFIGPIILAACIALRTAYEGTAGSSDLHVSDEV